MAQNKSHQDYLLSTLPQELSKTAADIIAAAKHYNTKSHSHHKKVIQQQIYLEAKAAQTEERDLKKALKLYGLSAKRGYKIDSCIKDYASVLHQMGYTKEAIAFLQYLQNFYGGDLIRYERLKNTLTKQLKPSIKHECKSLLLELPVRQKVNQQLLESMFHNVRRVKVARIHSNLALDELPEEEGKWLILQFESFSAAKKTLQKFKYEDWFGLNKYWLKGNLIMCEANDGRNDFEKCWLGKWMGNEEQDNCMLWNQKAVRLIEGQILNDIVQYEFDQLEQEQI